MNGNIFARHIVACTATAMCVAGSFSYAYAVPPVLSTVTVAQNPTPPTPPSEDVVNGLRAQLFTLDTDITNTQNLIVAANAQTAATTVRVQEVETNIAALEAQKTQYRDTISTYAKNMYASGDVSSVPASLTAVLTKGPAGMADLTRNEHVQDTFGGNEIGKVSQLNDTIVREQGELAVRSVEQKQAKDDSSALVGKLSQLNIQRADAVKKLSDETSRYTVLLAKYVCESALYNQQYAQPTPPVASSSSAVTGSMFAPSLIPTSTQTPPPTATSSGSVGNGKKLWDILISEGFTPEAAAGILGNLQQESNINPLSVQSPGPGRGIAQWSVGGRWDTSSPNLVSFAAYTSSDPWDIGTQTRFMLVEMKNSWGGFNIEKYKHMTDVVEAAVYFHDVFEQSADSHSQVVNVRGGYAQSWYAMFKNTVPIIAVAPQPSTVAQTPSPTPAQPSPSVSPQTSVAPTPTLPEQNTATVAGVGQSAIVLASCPAI